MARSVELRLESSSTIELFPLQMSLEGNEYLVGRHDARSWLALTPVALEAMSMLGEQVPVGRVKQALATKYGVDTVSLAPLLQQLLSAGFVRAVDGRSTQETTSRRPSRRRVLTRARVAPLFGKAAFLAYAAILAMGIVAVASDPRCLPRVRLLAADRDYGMLLLALLVMAVVAVKHEFAHIAAGRFLGVDASWRLGYRLFFPVIETDLSGLWLVTPRSRYLAYLAGGVSDLLAAALALAVIWAHLHGWIALSSTVYRALELTVLVVAAVVAWQCNVFLRTDGYYVLANALGCRNLAGDAKAYLRSRLAWSAASTWDPASAGFIRFYAIGYLATVACLCALWILGLAAALRAGGGSARSTLVAELISAALLAAAIVGQRRRRRVAYRIVCPPDL